jgi:hypothetical protein
MAIDISPLSDEQCVGLLRLIARRWFEHAGVDAFVVYQRVQGCVDERKIAVPLWIEGSAKHASADLVKTSRVALETIADGKDGAAKAWLQEAIEDLESAHAHMFDPLTLSIFGATLIGCILAARAKKIGSVEFYKGLPPELAKVIKAVSPVLNKS